MKLENMLITEEASIRDALKRLETYRCKNLYVVSETKLLAAISDGDIRRYLLADGDMNGEVSNIANYHPVSFHENEQEEIKKVFLNSDLQSIPVVNLNREICSIVFRNDAVLTKDAYMDIPVVIMAGGKGTRLYPYTKILPKALIPVGDIPITEHIIERFYKYGCKDFHMIVNHKKEMIRAYFDAIEKPYHVSMEEEEKPLGTGGGLALLKGKIKSDFILSNCDILVDADYAEIYQKHIKNDNFITIVVARKKVCIPYGVIQINDKEEYLGVKEKPVHHYLINTGIYIANQQVIEELKDNTACDFPEIVQKYYENGKKIGSYVVEEDAFMDMGQLEELENMRVKLGIS